jgi:hypothetical protein
VVKKYLLAVAILAGIARGAIKSGPEVGAKIRAFSLTDQNGKTRTLGDIAGPKGAMLVFFRSADW